MIDVNLKFTAQFSVEFSVVPQLDVTLQGVTGSGFPRYDGEYELTPTQMGGEVECVNKIMRENIVIKPILYSSAANRGGGLTITIGG